MDTAAQECYTVPWPGPSIIHFLFWCGWINICVAFNAIPMVPLDGGYILKGV